jgi:predicted house-cleaning noncanonical NTP pyrophosphatase (MazG superfamily)
MKKVKKIIEQRIEKHLDLVDELSTQPTNVLNNMDTNTNVPIVIENQNEHKDNDFQYARENMYDVIEKGRDAMEELLEIAKAEESPRAFEVFGQLLKNMSDAQEKLMELHRKKNQIENDKERQDIGRAQNVTNALFVGSTAELLKLVKQENRKDE